MTLQLTSPGFADGANIPAKHTCDGEDVSPPLRWTDSPAGTKSFALIADDPDAPRGTWVHWVMYSIPSSLGGLPEGVPKTETVADSGRQGVNDFKRTGYGGPCPPRGNSHRYFFKLYALDSDVPLKSGATKQAVLNAIQGHIVGEGQLMGKYKRR